MYIIYHYHLIHAHSLILIALYFTFTSVESKLLNKDGLIPQNVDKHLLIPTMSEVSHDTSENSTA